ncbi:MAG TPA: hypothetical protein VIF10_03490 [Methylobacter sp.]|jgi:hypothetical protein
MNKTFKITAYFLASVFCAVFLAGCFFHPSLPTPEERSEKVEQLIAEGGYSASRNYPIDSIRQTWRHDGQDVAISMLAPKAPGVYPLIIYLPGLGEPADAGLLWRETWAKAGYAVFSMQPLDISEALKELAPMRGKSGDDEGSYDEDNSTDSESRPSKAVINSELHYLGHEYFSQAALKKRISHLLWAFAQLKQRATANQALFKAADLSRLIIAGYDIGAQTTAAMIGEKVESDLPPQAQDFRPLAAILLSPSVDLAIGGLKTRDKNISMPLLVVTGSEDDDPYGISSPYVRTAIWEYAPLGNKYLLLLNKGGHQILAGSHLSHRQNSRPAQDSGEKIEPSNAMPHVSSNNSFRGRKGGGSIGGSSGGMGRGWSSHGGRLDSERDFKHIAAVSSISTAFLDNVCKSDKFAQSWLSGKAKQWLKKSADLKTK